MKKGQGDEGLFTYQGVPLWRDDRILKGVAQVISAVLILGFLIFFLSNVFQAAAARGLSLGFDYLKQSAGFPIGETTLIDYDPSMSFGRAFLVGFLNTLRVSLIGIVLATIFGTILGVSRLSSNWLVRSLAGVYIEIVRNVPLLVTLFFLFFGVFQALPSVDESLSIGNFLFLNQRGVYLAWFNATSTTTAWVVISLLAIILAMIVFVVLGSYQLRTGRSLRPGLWALGILIVLPTLSWILLPERPLLFDLPVLGDFNFVGGKVFTTQYAALLTGLVLYTSAFIAEIVRAGIQSVSRGQVEAASSIGLKPFQSLRLVIFPQALRVAIPPLISQYLNLTKNSSLAIAIGYPDLFAVSRITINQAGRAVPVFLLVMATYLLLSLTYSVILNLYNRRVAFVER